MPMLVPWICISMPMLSLNEEAMSSSGALQVVKYPSLFTSPLHFKDKDHYSNIVLQECSDML